LPRFAPNVLGGDAVHPGRKVGVVDGPDDVRPGQVEDLVAALMAVEVAEGDGAGLEHGAHGPVGHDNPLAQGGSQLAGRMPGRAVTCRHRAPHSNGGERPPGATGGSHGPPGYPAIKREP
jgi:hypothetical protein